MAITLTHYLALAGALFLTGMVGFIVRRNALIMLMSVELMLSSTNVVFAAFSRHWGDASGHVFVLMNFAVAAAEAAIGLAILVEIYRRRRTVNVDELKVLME
jgi:NADH-quinone oxidoreductase subunit K